jgi:hypothetical protein
MNNKSDAGSVFGIIIMVPIALFIGFLWGSGRAVVNYVIAFKNNVKLE